MVENFFIVFIILLTLISAILGIQIADESVLVLKIKQWFLLTQPYNKKLLKLSTFSFWWKYLDKFYFLLLPLLFIFLILINFHQFLSTLTDCSKCVSVWILFFLLYTLTGETLTICLVLSPLSILWVYILNKIKA